MFVFRRGKYTNVREKIIFKINKNIGLDTEMLKS